MLNIENNSYAHANGSSGVFINPAEYDSNNNILYANKVRFNGNHSNYNRLVIICKCDLNRIVFYNLVCNFIQRSDNEKIY